MAKQVVFGYYQTEAEGKLLLENARKDIDTTKVKKMVVHELTDAEVKKMKQDEAARKQFYAPLNAAQKKERDDLRLKNYNDAVTRETKLKSLRP